MSPRLAVVIGMLALCERAGSTAPARLRIGDSLPAIEISRLESPPRKVRLAALREPLAISFFHKACGPCYRELPALHGVTRALNAELRAARKPRIRVVVVVVGAPPAPGLVAQLGKDTLWLHDPDARAAQAFDPQRYPCTFLVDARGRVRHINRGFGPGYPVRVRAWLRRMLSLQP